jgi:hypothetical protein
VTPILGRQAVFPTRCFLILDLGGLYAPTHSLSCTHKHILREPSSRTTRGRSISTTNHPVGGPASTAGSEVGQPLFSGQRRQHSRDCSAQVTGASAGLQWCSTGSGISAAGRNRPRHEDDQVPLPAASRPGTCHCDHASSRQGAGLNGLPRRTGRHQHDARPLFAAPSRMNA